ncbi:MAG: hypothetical protein GIX03_02715 [Candidatus Eremiobacteraeota bacterium]|nr:hypothetical protein [Candidatus Eremiobacteraeota bacterium]MBC5805010.1 hypothetical protein [Candidatus Eremiobacteraeota bacterium]MBC5825542.1 hypothetical protein [Candidatus Eremiobacteraeota bacterium]
MNPLLTKTVAFAESVAAAEPGGVCREDVNELFVTGRFTAETGKDCAALAQELSAAGLAQVTVVNNRDEGVVMDEIAGTTGAVRIRIMKPCTKSTVYFFTLDGLSRFVEDPSGLDEARTVLVASEFEAFSTQTIVFRSWEDPVSDVAEARSDEEIDARRVVYGPDGSVPKRIGPLIFTGTFPAPSTVSDVWARRAWHALAALLVDEVRAVDAARRMLTITAPRTSIEQMFTEAVDRESLRLVCEAARWTYASSFSMDSRHALIAAELGRMWHDNETWDGGFRRVGARALESAKSAERLMISGKTSEVINAEGDLRKALNDEVGRVNQQIRDLTGALWRDFAVAIAALVARASLAKGGGATDIFGSAVLIGAAVFLIASIGVVVYANRRLLTIARNARTTWQSDVYAFLAEPEIESLALKPIREAETVYFCVEKIVVGAYVVVIAAILFTAFGINSSVLLGAPSASPSP